MRKSYVLLIIIAVCLMSAPPSYAQNITYSNGIQTQSATPTKGDKVKCRKDHSPLVKIPKFKLVKQTCQDLYSGQSSMKFKAEKIYVSSSSKVIDLIDATTNQLEALKKSLVSKTAKGWTLSSISASEGMGSGWTASLSYINRKTKVALFADLEVEINVQYGGCLDERCGQQLGKSWVTISVTNLHREFWE